jgi:hypothetical protein
VSLLARRHQYRLKDQCHPGIAQIIDNARRESEFKINQNQTIPEKKQKP